MSRRKKKSAPQKPKPGVQGRQPLAEGSGGSASRVRRLLPFALLLLLVSSAFLLLSRWGRVRPQGPVILISIDTLRADHLPVYGYPLLKAPALDALAQDGVVFEGATSAVPLTFPSHATILTGLLPFEHGIRDNTGFHLERSVPTLATTLKAAGYATGAAVSAFVLRTQTGLSHDFDFYQDVPLTKAPSLSMGEVQRDGAETVESGLGWLRERLDGRKPGDPAKVFLFLHLYEPHKPYQPPERYAKQYPGRPYDGEIAYADELVGRVTAELKRLDLYDSSLIILLSDHGEGLGDHGETDHGVFLYQGVLHVPLIVKLPGQENAGARLAGRVSLADIAPTVHEVEGLPPLARASGRSLAPALWGGSLPSDREVYSESLYPRYHFGWKQLYALTGLEHAFILAPQDEFYDLRSDPAETKNLLLAKDLAEALRSLAGRFKARLEDYVAEGPITAPAAVSKEEADKMQALGYVGAATLGSGDEKDLPDPKDRIGALEIYRKAILLKFQHKFEESISELRQLLELNPEMTDVWDQVSELLQRVGRDDEAIEALKKGLSIAPNRPERLIEMADLLLRKGDKAGARAHLEAASVMDPSRGYLALALFELGEGKLDEAREFGRKSAQTLTPSGPFVEARLLLEEKRYAEALPLLLEAQEKAKNLPGQTLPSLNFYLADVLARQEKYAEAEDHFLRELELYPGNADAILKLCALYRAQDRISEIDKTLTRYSREFPSKPTYARIAEVYKIFGLAEQEARWRARAE